MKLKNHVTREYEGIVLERIRHLPPGGKMGDLPEHLWQESFVRVGEKNTGGPNMRLYRLEKDVPSLTVTAYIFNKFVHPKEDRYITPREAACLQDFPLDWEFKGTLGQVQKQVGNAVPVRLAEAVARSVLEKMEAFGHSGAIKVASYFSGAGGLDLGFEAASTDKTRFETVFTNDIEPWAEATVNANRPGWNFVRKDIRELGTDEVLSVAGCHPDVIIGGPPCQPFSVAGKQKATDDPLGRLYSDFIRQVRELRPKIVVMENVYGLMQVKSANMLELIYRSFHDIGYQVTHQELLAADYGSPQKRRRVFFVASQDLKGFKFPEPTHCEHPNLLGLPLYVGAGTVLSGLPKPIVRGKSVGQPEFA
jgi:DNA (cytosine-5)-methyltransferase 1